MKLFLVVTLIAAVATNELPSSFKYCKHDATLDKCLLDTIPPAIKALASGYRPLKISPLDPLLIPKLVIPGSGSVDVTQTYTNLKIHGMTDFKLINVSTTADLVMELEMLKPKIEILGNYSLDGRLLLVPVTGQGRCNITSVNVNVKYRLVGEEYQKNGDTYVRVKEFVVRLAPGRAYYQFDNLFGGSKELGANINKLINENWKGIFDEAGSAFEELYSVALKEAANKIFAAAPKDKIFLK